MRVHGRILAVLSTGIALANASPARAQDATSANLPEQFETREAVPRPKPKKKKAERSLKTAASASVRKPAPATEQKTPAAELRTAAARVEKKSRVKKRATSAVQPQMASASTPTPLSLAAAQAMAVSAPLPEYPYQAKRANITGSGVCVMTVDTASGKVTDATMTQSTGDGILDKATIYTFRKWRFKPGTASQVGVPVDYE